jgi:hypothetical protein
MEASAGDVGPQDPGNHGNDSGQAPDDQQMAININDMAICASSTPATPQRDAGASEAVQASDQVTRRHGRRCVVIVIAPLGAPPASSR